MPIGSLAHVGLGKETTFGTAVAASDYIRFASESLNEEIEQVQSEGIMGLVDAGPQYEGLHTVSGDLSGDVYPNVIGHLLRSAFGAPVTTTVAGATGAYQHVFTPVQANFSSACALPPYTYEVHRDLNQAFQYTGAVVNELTFAFGSDSKLMTFSAGIIAKALNLITKTTPTFDAQDPFTWNQAVVTLNGTANQNVSQIEFGISNELEAKDTLDGTRNISRILRNGRRTFPVNFTLELNDLTEYNLFRAQNEVSLKIELTGALINGTAYNKLTIDVPKFHFNTFPINVGGAGAINAAVDGVAEYSTADNHAMKITLINSKVSY